MTLADPRRELTVERVRVRILEAALSESVPMSFSRLDARRVCLVELHADGLVGFGESWINYPPWAAAERLATVCDGAAEIVLGRDARDPREIHRALVETLVPVGRQWGAPGPTWQTVSGVDLAAWDLLGKAVETPVGELLVATGATRAGVPVYGSGVGPTQVEDLCRRALDMGVTAVKAKLGFGRERDEATVAMVRRVMGDIG